MAESESLTMNEITAQDQSTDPVHAEVYPEQPATTAAVTEPPLIHAVAESSVATEEPPPISNEASPTLSDRETEPIDTPPDPTCAEVVEQVPKPEEVNAEVHLDTENSQDAAIPIEPSSEEKIGSDTESHTETVITETNPAKPVETKSIEATGACQSESTVSSITTDSIVSGTEQPDLSTESHPDTVITFSEESTATGTDPQQTSQIVRPISFPLPFLPVRTAQHHIGYAIRGLF